MSILSLFSPFSFFVIAHSLICNSLCCLAPSVTHSVTLSLSLNSEVSSEIKCIGELPLGAIRIIATMRSPTVRYCNIFVRVDVCSQRINLLFNCSLRDPIECDEVYLQLLSDLGLQQVLTNTQIGFLCIQSALPTLFNVRLDKIIRMI